MHVSGVLNTDFSTISREQCSICFQLCPVKSVFAFSLVLMQVIYRINSQCDQTSLKKLENEDGSGHVTY